MKLLFWSLIGGLAGTAFDGHRRDLFRESKIYEWRGVRRHQSPWALGAEHV